MNIDIQFNKEKFQDIVLSYVQREVITNHGLGLEGIIYYPFNGINSSSPPEPGVIDHISIDGISLEYEGGGNRTMTKAIINTPSFYSFFGDEDRVPRRINELEIGQLIANCDITLLISKVQSMKDASDLLPIGALTEQGVRAGFHVTQPTISADNRNLVITFEPKTISFKLGNTYVDSSGLSSYPEIVELAEDILETMEENAEEWFPPINFPIGSISGQLGDLAIWNVGLSARGDFVNFRLQVEKKRTFLLFSLSGELLEYSWLDDWRQFFNDDIVGKIGTLDWGVAFPIGLFEEQVDTEIGAGIAEDERVDLNEIKHKWEISNTDDPEGCYQDEEGTLKTNVSVKLLNACIPWGLDIDVNVSVETTFHIANPGEIVLTLNLDHAVDPGDAFVCIGLTAMAASFFAMTNGILFESIFLGHGAAVIGGVAGAMTVVGFMESTPIPTFDSNEDLVPIPPEGADPDDENIEIKKYEYTLEVEPVENRVLGNVAITSLHPCSDSLVAGGSLTNRIPVYIRFHEYSIIKPRWVGPRRSLCGNGDITTLIRAELGYLISRTAGLGSLPIVKWGFEIIEQYPDFDWPEPIIHHYDGSVAVRFNVTKSEIDELKAHAGSQVPFIRVLHQTNAGAAIITLKIENDELTQTQYDELRNDVIARCNANQDLIDVFEDRLGSLRDIIRGPIGWPAGQPIDFMGWTIRINDFDPQTKIELVAKDDAQMVSFGQIKLNQNGGGLATFWQSKDQQGQHPLLRMAGMQQYGHAAHPGYMVELKTYRIINSLTLGKDFRSQELKVKDGKTVLSVLEGTMMKTYTVDKSGDVEFLRTSQVQNENNLVLTHMVPITSKSPQLPKDAVPVSSAGSFATTFDKKSNRLLIMKEQERFVGGYLKGKK